MELLEKLLGKDYLNKMRISDKLRIMITLIALIILLFTLYIYRPYIYNLNIYDFSISGSFPSLIYEIIVVQAANIYNYLKNDNFNNILLVFAVATGLIIAEIIQNFTSIGTFDLNDILYIIIGIPLVICIEKIFKLYR